MVTDHAVSLGSLQQQYEMVIFSSTVVNMCTDVSIAYSTTGTTPTSSSAHGTAYTLVCLSGYSASSSSGSLDCAPDGTWNGKPTCNGNK